MVRFDIVIQYMPGALYVMAHLFNHPSALNFYNMIIETQNNYHMTEYTTSPARRPSWIKANILDLCSPPSIVSKYIEECHLNRSDHKI